MANTHPYNRYRSLKEKAFGGGRRRRVLRVFGTVALIAGGILLLAGTIGYYYLTYDLPALASLTDYRPKIITTVYTTDGQVIGEFAEERRRIVPIESIPPNLINALLAAEDARFYQHKGLDYVSILRAALKNLRRWEIVQGGSTITQQVAKSLVGSEKTFKRKAREAILAYRIEKNLEKDEILFLYVNQIYFGHGAYGVAMAAETFFDKPVSETTLAEAAMIAGLVRAPSRDNPHANPEQARTRQSYVLTRMGEENFITIAEAVAATKEPIRIVRPENVNLKTSPYFTEHVRMYLYDRFGQETVLTDGLKVYTTLHSEMQLAAREAARRGLHDLDRRQGYRGPLDRVGPRNVGVAIKKRLPSPPISKWEAGKTVRGIVTKVTSRRAEVALAPSVQGILRLDEMKWARKPDPEVGPHMISSMKKALQVSDVIEVKIKELPKGVKPEGPNPIIPLVLAQEPKVQAALLALDARTGDVRAMVGGYDFRTNEFNRAVRMRRQPGSAFKPIIYAAAIDQGFTEASAIVDSPIGFYNEEKEEYWKPQNYGEKFKGQTTLRDGFTHSINIVAIKLLQQIGVGSAIQYAKRLGIPPENLSPDLTLALGSSSVSLPEILRAYSAFATGGRLLVPAMIERVEDRNEEVIERWIGIDGEPVPEESLGGRVAASGNAGDEQAAGGRNGRPLAAAVPSTSDGRVDGGEAEDPDFPPGNVIPRTTAYLVTDLMKAVIEEGTGRSVRALGRPAAGKTGTTNDRRDAWFIGYTPDLIAGVWVGFDNDKLTLGHIETGSRAAGPIWLHFMKRATKRYPPRDFMVPRGIVFAKVDLRTGELALPGAEETAYIAFKAGTEPRPTRRRTTSRPVDFFKEDLSP